MQNRDAATRVMMVSTTYPATASDWRGLFIRNLVFALSRIDELQLKLWAPPGEVPANVAQLANESERNWLAALMRDGGIAHRFRRDGLSGKLAVVQLLAHEFRAYRRAHGCNIFHVNWLQNALVLPRNQVPAVVSVLGTDLQLLKVPLMRTALRRAFAGRVVAICPNADWMVGPLRAAFGDVTEVEYIPFGIDSSWFSIERRRPTNCRRWLIVSRLTADKLGPVFNHCREYFEQPNRELHLFGPMQEPIEVPHWVHYHGSIDAESLRQEWFPGAAGLISLSVHAEGRPQVMLEAMAAGLPIIASNISAHASLLRHGDTGYLCDSKEDAQRGLCALEDASLNTRIGLSARSWARAEFGSWDDCAARYARCYQRLNVGVS